ncbi:MAG TPA: ATP-binding protein [Nocardioidaceae bacterium]|nr:ATP-binding protein [Nocardioidaceae bacterium]
MAHARELEPDPRSVRDARAWVVEQLSTLGRPDLVDAARLAVSELVTNAILHGEPPISVRIGGTPAHPRVEVHDRSTEPPSARDMPDEARLLATVGRGLGIVATYSTAWGAEMSRSGKVVWFEPAPEEAVADDAAPALGEVSTAEELVEAALRAEAEAEQRVTISLLGMPAQVFAHMRLQYEELRRELRLLALSHGTEYPFAQRLAELTTRVERERHHSSGADRLSAAITHGVDRVDVVYDVPASSPATMARLRDVLDEADEFCREQQLLVAPPTPQMVALRSWYLGEFERQGRGEDPLPWTGGYTVEDAVQ